MHEHGIFSEVSYIIKYIKKHWKITETVIYLKQGIIFTRLNSSKERTVACMILLDNSLSIFSEYVIYTSRRAYFIPPGHWLSSAPFFIENLQANPRDSGAERWNVNQITEKGQS